MISALRWKRSLLSRRMKSSLIVGVILFVLSITCDKIMYWKGVQAAETYLNDLVIGVTGGICAGLILSFQASRDAMERARERMLLTAELNQQLRGVVMTMANSALLPDEMDRLRAMDEAVEQIDEVLSGIGPAAAAKTFRN
jgi:hypothetical protein